MIKSIPDPQRVHSITCPKCKNSFIITHLHSNPAFCTICGAPLSAPSPDKHLSLVEGHEPETGTVQFSIGTYQVLSSIGKGGMGEVFLAYDTSTGRKLALKKVRSDLLKHPQIKGRFLREARITCQLTHPSIIPIYGISQEGEEIYYTMPFVEGENLKQILRRARKMEKQGDKPDASIASLVPIFIDICQAIAYAHSKQVLHRDLKPENIIIGKYGEALILDWGLAKLAAMKEDDLPSNLNTGGTRTGKVVGTLSYLSPERALGAEASAKSDIYALGVILYQILTLKMPFNRGSLKEFRKNMPAEELIDPIEAAPYREVPRVLSQICLRMLDRDPAKRYPNLNEVLYDLEGYIEGRAEFYPAASLNTRKEGDWEFQENVLITEQFAITRGAEANWFNLMISKLSFRENLKIDVSFKIGEESKGVGFLLNVPEASERKNLTDGYLLWLSTSKEEPSKLLRSNVEVLTIPELHLEPAQKYELRIEKIDKSLNVWINNELELSYVSHIPETGTHVGFVTRDFDYAIDKFNVSEGSQNVLVSCLVVPDAFLAQKEYERALSEYRRIGYSFPGRSEGREALFRAGVTLMEQAIETKDETFFDRALDEFEKLKKTPASPLEYLGKALVYNALHDTEEELKCYELALRRDPKHPLNYILEEQILFRTYESLASDRKMAYAFLLIILRHLPRLASSHAVLRIINNLVTHAEPLYFIEWEKKLRKDPRQISILLAYWLNKPFTLYEIVSRLDLTEKTLVYNGLYALRILDEELFHDILIKKGFPFDTESLDERELFYQLTKKLDERNPDAVLEALKQGPLSVPLSCLKIEAHLLKKDFREAGIELSHYPLEWHTKETTLLPFLYGVWLHETEGKELAQIHFSAALETAFPRTWTLGSLALAGKLPSNWEEKALWNEKAELDRQLKFFHDVTSV